MADFYKSLDNAKDVVNTRTLLHEAIPLTGSIVSGTYADNNIKTYSHGMFNSVYDYPYLSSSANHIFDIAVGVSANNAEYGSISNQQSKKKNIYNQMAQVLMGYDVTGSILEFDEDGNILAGGTKNQHCFFLNFSRLLVKDEIKKGSFQLDLGMTPALNYAGRAFSDIMRITDDSGSDGYFVNSPVGEYGILYATASSTTYRDEMLEGNFAHPVGLLFYQAGVAVVTSSVFLRVADGGILKNSYSSISMSNGTKTTETWKGLMTGSTVNYLSDNLRNRIHNVQFNNTVELNSTIYYCRANHNEFNYSTNPTYLTGSKIRVKTFSTDMPVSYITTIGLYNDNNELMAVGKLSEPLKKSPDQEFTLRARLDY